MAAFTATLQLPCAGKTAVAARSQRAARAAAVNVAAPSPFQGFHRHSLTSAKNGTTLSQQVRMDTRRSARSGGVRSATVAQAAGKYDYDLVIIGCGVGGHGAAIHAVENGLKVAVLESHDIGGTCVNRGCVPSKALLAASGRVRDMKNEMHLKSMGIQIDAANVTFDRQGIADHATDLASKIQGNLANSLIAMGVDILEGAGKFVDNHTVSYGKPGRVDLGGKVTAKNIIIATGSVPFVPPGIQIDGKTVFTSDHALKMEWLPEWVAIIGSGYIGLEFSDVYTALGSDVTFIEAMDKLMPGFDNEVGKLAQRVLINPRNIDYRTGVLATSVKPGVPGVKPVEVTLTDFKTKEVVEVMEVDAVLVATGRAPYTEGLGLAAINSETDRRGFVQANDKMQVIDKDGKAIENVFCIGDANGKYMLAHAASAQGISAVENMIGHPHEVNHLSVPAACFTHPEISFVGLTEEAAQEKADKEKFTLGVAKTAFKANSKALAELESDGICKVIYNKQTGEILGVHILGLHAADLIHEASNAIAMGKTVNDIKFAVHAHPTLSEVIDETFKQTHADIPVPHMVGKAKASVKA